MSRRVVGGALVVASALAGVPQSYGDDPPPPLLPVATCETRVNDKTGDGVAVLNPNVQPLPAVGDPRGNVTALDITAVTFRLSRTKVYAFMSVNDITNTFRDTDSAYGYTMRFTRGTGGKVARFDALYTNPAHVTQGFVSGTGYPKASVGTGISGGDALTGVGGGVDPTKNIVYVYADRASLEERLGAPIEDGEELTAITGLTSLWLPNKNDSTSGTTQRPADATEAEGAAATWKVGDDRCFPPSTIAVPTVSVQYGDPATLTATLTGEGSAPLASKPVTFLMAGEETPRPATTDSNGKARLALGPAPVAGTYKFTVSFAGDESSGAASETGSLVVRTEAIRVAPLKVTRSGTSRTVTATFTEDDPRAFGRQPVAWYVNGRRVSGSYATDLSGRSVFKAAKPGQKVQVRYLGLTGRYAAVSSKTVVA